MIARVIEIMIESFWKILLPGLIYTIPLAVVSFAIGLVIALFTAIAQVSKAPVLGQVSRLYVWIFRGTPLLVQLYIIFYGLPGAGIMINPIPAAIIVLSLNVGSYASESVRATILSIPTGQMEAGYCAGLTYWQTMYRIILPQAFRVAFPTLGNSFINLIKETSLTANITVMEMFRATQKIVANTYEPLALYCEVAFIYLIFCTILSRFQSFGEKKLSAKMVVK